MNILVYGAGVIGSVYAARLHAAGHTVTVLARGERLEEIRAEGLGVEDVGTGLRTVAHVATTAALAPEDAYDAIFVTVRADQIDEVLPALAANKAAPMIVTFVNLASGAHRLAEALGPRRLVLGFPGLGGGRQGTVVRYTVLRQQPTMLGMVDGGDASKLRPLVAALRATGLPVATTSRMEAWLTCHAVFIAAMESALLRADGDALRLAASREAVAQMAQAVREGFHAGRALGIPIIPANLRVLYLWMPREFAVRYWRRALRSPVGTVALAPHATAARTEALALADEVRTLLAPSPVATPTLNALLASV
jgi:2-dehydropantoate 2-reductase